MGLKFDRCATRTKSNQRPGLEPSISTEALVQSTNTFKVGDQVILHEDEGFVRKQFEIFYNGHICWIEEVARPMLGKTYPVVPKEVCKNDGNWVALPINDSSCGRIGYFPKTTLKRVEQESICTFSNTQRSFDHSDYYYQCITCNMTNGWKPVEGTGGGYR